MKRTKLALIIPLLLSANLAQANEYPPEFSEFFQEKEEIVSIGISGDRSLLPVKAIVSYGNFEMVNSEENIKNLRAFLLEKKVSTSHINIITTQLISGINNTECSNSSEECIPKDIEDQAEFVFDYDNSKLSIFVSTDMLERSLTAEYHDGSRNNNAIINKTNLYAFANESNANFNWSNDTIVGLPKGYFQTETEYVHSDSDFDIHSAEYDLEFDDQRIIVGYRDDSRQKQINSTDFMSFGADYTGYSLTYASSHNLVKGDTRALQSILFYAPQSGQLEVYRDDRLIVSRAIKQGQQSIGYDEIPIGVYNVRIVVKQGENVIIEEVQQVVNTNAFKTPVGNVDFRASVGLLINDETNSSNSQQNIALEDKGFGQLVVSNRISENLLLAGSVGTDANDVMLQVGGNYVFNDSLGLDYTSSYFTSGGTYQYGAIRVSPFVISGKYIDVSNDENSFSNVLYGDEKYTEMGVGVYGSILGGTSYLNYYRFNTEYGTNYRERDNTTDNVSLSYNRDLFGGRFTFNTTYSRYNDNSSEFNTTLSMTYELSDLVSSVSSISTDQDGFNYARQDFTKQIGNDDWDVSATATAKTYEDDVSVEASYYLGGSDDVFNYSSYGHVSSEGYRSISGTITGSQILSTRGNKMTNQLGESFVSVEPKWTGRQIEDTYMNYEIYRDSNILDLDEVTVGENVLIELPVYSDVEVALNADYGDFEFENRRYKHFVMPGTYYKVDNKVTPLESQIIVLNDLYGNPVLDASCINDSCNSIQSVSEDGVYRVNYRQGDQFQIVANDLSCVYNQDHLGGSYMKSYCLEGISLTSEKGQTVYDGYTFIGKYLSTNKTEEVISRLEELGIAFKKINVGDNLYVYVKYQEVFTTTQNLLFETLEEYAVYDQPEHTLSLR